MQPAPKKSLGQHFLISPGISAKIVSLLNLAAQDQIVEIGPGPGALTGLLSDSPHRRLLLIEKDKWWASERGKSGHCEVLEMDALKFDWSGLCESGQWKLVGNLPYNIASPLIWEIVSTCRCYDCAVFMVQKEVGERIGAAPDSRKYGALSVWIASYALAKYQFTVHPGAFRPPPKVDSAVISLRPLPVWPEFPDILKRLLDYCFQRRRKQLGSIFRQGEFSVLLPVLAELGIDPHLRPENLSAAEFQALSRILATA